MDTKCELVDARPSHMEGEGRHPPKFLVTLPKKEVGKVVAFRATISPMPLKFFIWFNKDHENTEISSQTSQ